VDEPKPARKDGLKYDSNQPVGVVTLGASAATPVVGVVASVEDCVAPIMHRYQRESRMELELERCGRTGSFPTVSGR
jgi:hypothetical protein